MFWEDVWKGDNPLAITFPALYQFSSKKHNTVNKFLLCWNSENSAKNLWTTSLPQTLAIDVYKLQCILNGIHLSTKDDILIWKPARGKYTPKKSDKFMVCSTLYPTRFRLESDLVYKSTPKNQDLPLEDDKWCYTNKGLVK